MRNYAVKCSASVNSAFFLIQPTFPLASASHTIERKLATIRFCQGEQTMTANHAWHIGLLSTALLLSGCEQDHSAGQEIIRPVRAMKVGDVTQLQGREFPGHAKAVQEVDLSFRVAGPLIALPVKVGDKVTAGDTIARIDPRDFEVQQRKTEGELQRAIANRVRAKSEYERLLRIQKTDRDAVADVTVGRGKENYQLAKADIAAYQASVDAARDAVSYSRLKAPFDGTIASTFVENFESVQAQQPIVRLLDSSRVEFEFHVPETMISLVPLVRNLRVRFDAFSDLQIAAQVKEIGSEASATTRTYPVTLIMEQPEGAEILPGMSGKVSGEVRSPSAAGAAAIIVPMSAVFSPASDDQSFVWVIDEASSTVSRRQVSIGDVGAAGLRVKEGLQVGELIATAGVHFLTEGQQVRPQRK